MNGRWKLKGKLQHYTFSLFVYVHDLDSRQCVCIIPSCLGRALIDLSWFLHYSEFRCRCNNCDTELLSNALEFRCCKEVTAAMAKLTFEGIEGNCVLDHPDFDALTNATVLEQVCPLMKDKEGRAYKFPTRGTQNAKKESCRATAYRFLVRWIFGPLGWNNTRPLPACIYNRIRQKYQTASTRGYSSAEQRQN